MFGEKWIFTCIILFYQIKGAQYLSHRPDLVSKKMIQKMKHLRDNTPMHSFQHTVEILIKNGIYDQIDYINERAIASGIIG